MAGNQPVEPSRANGAQIPLEDFNIPQFPREAGGLMALTLTSAIEGDNYLELLQQPFTVTHLPPSIQSLTLELFALGYPQGFLKALIAELPELRSLVIFSQLFTGTSNETVEDAIAFIGGAKKLRALHLLDTFVTTAFVKGIAPLVKKLEKPLMFVEVNYTNRPEDKDFMTRIPTADLPLLVHPGLVSFSLNIASPEASDAASQEESDALQEGIQTVGGKHSDALTKALLDDETAPRVVKGLNITLYSISPDQLRQIVAKHKGLMVINVSVAVGGESEWKTPVFNALAAGENLEQIEIVLCPTSDTFELDLAIEEKRLTVLAGMCKKLTSLKVNQLRCQTSKMSVECSLAGGRWKIEVKGKKDPIEAATGNPVKTKAVSSDSHVSK